MTYILDIFDSKNSYTSKNIDFKHWINVISHAKRLSTLQKYPVVARNGKDFAQAENGEITEASQADYFRI